MMLRPTLSLAILFFTQWGQLVADDTVNPHWTGTHCLECHTDDRGGRLRYQGDSIQLCNRCHADASAPADPHPVNVLLPGTMRKEIASSWPLQDEKITCLTCHDAVAQMHDNPLAQLLNPSFLRSSSAPSHGDFCFTCHDKKDYRKENPHEQLNTAGVIVEKTCLSCHFAVPDADQAYDAVRSSLRGDAGRLCISCHGGKDVNHPIRGNHLVSVPDTMQEIQRLKTTKQGVYLPLVSNRLSCVTCHNPHQRGVLKKSGAAAGAGEAYFLRLRRGQELCTHCHQDIQVPDVPGEARQSNVPVTPKPEGTIQHQPYREGKCKACHAIDGYAGENRESLVRCFREGCHETSLIRNTFVHAGSVLGSCSFCHSPHSSGNAKLLFTDENTLCSTCHPLLRGKGNAPLREADHKMYVAYASNNLTLPAGYECYFCHNPAHRREMQAVSTEQCGACHTYLRKAISSNSHQQYADRACSACHLPHVAPYKYLLKQPPETYQHQ